MKRIALRDREEAGRLLAGQLQAYRKKPDCLVVALPRGGVITGFEIARALELPLDVLIVRKLGVPGQPELAMGAIASGGARVLNEDLIVELGISAAEVEGVAAMEQIELERRERVYREGRPALDVSGRTVILVDDGVATGATLRAAVATLKKGNASRIVVAVGVAPPETVRALQGEVDEVRVVMTPEPFGAIGIWFHTFPQTTDQEVRERLHDSPGLSAKLSARRTGSAQ